MIEKQTIGKYTVLEIKGMLMGGPETSELNKCIEESLDCGNDWIVFDLGDVRWINSAGVGALVAGYVNVSHKQGVIKFANLSDKVKDVLELTKLITILDIHDSVESAVK